MKSNWISRINMSNKKIYQIVDDFHPHLYIEGKGDRLIKSTMFDTDEDFFNWCRQHGADNMWEEAN